MLQSQRGHMIPAGHLLTRGPITEAAAVRQGGAVFFLNSIHVTSSVEYPMNKNYNAT